MNANLRSHVQAWLSVAATDTRLSRYDLELHDVATWAVGQLRAGHPAHLLFVCTHNSRRSHLACLWAWAAASYLGLDGIQTCSAGTEATALNPRVVQTLRAHGFGVHDTGEVMEPGLENRRYEVSLEPDGPCLSSFSKTLEHPSLPGQHLAALMVCRSADAACPVVHSADVRVPMPFGDPKTSDGTPSEAATYAARSLEIGQVVTSLMGRVVRQLG